MVLVYDYLELYGVNAPWPFGVLWILVRFKTVCQMTINKFLACLRFFLHIVIIYQIFIAFLF